MSFESGTETYIGKGTKVVYYHHVPGSQSVVRIGNYSSIAEDISFWVDGNHRIDTASSFPFWERNNIRTGIKNGWGKGAPKVGHDVWIGSKCMVMSGVTIGDGAVVAGGSVVAKDVPPYAVVAGNPAIVKRYRFDEETIRQFQECQWWDLPHDYVIRELVPVQGDVPAWIEKAMAYRRQQQAI